MIRKLQNLFQPEQFQGQGKSKRYFEGWYYKIVNADETKAFAFIPGIAMNINGDKQAFVQVLDGKTRNAVYHKFSFNDFQFNPDKFEIRIGDNTFSMNTLKLDLPDIHGSLTFANLTPWSTNWYSPGIMGPFSFVPFMECYHGILSMDHTINGKLCINGEVIDFSNGRGYIEKDWGHSFPSAYFWMQTNHFSTPGISLKSSVAKIPWLGSSFVGFIAGLWLNDRLYTFTTYNSTRLLKSIADKNKVELAFENKGYRLDIIAHRHAATKLAAPIHGFMDGRIEESMTSEIDVILYDKKNKVVLLDDKGRNAGLEVAGKISKITIP